MIKQTIIKLSKGGEEVLHYEEISGKGVKYRLKESCSFETGIVTGNTVRLGPCITLGSCGGLVLFKGYEWNGPNVIFDKPKAMRASAIHDAMCELVAAGRLSMIWMPRVNNIFRDICKEDGMPERKFRLYRWVLRKHWQGWFK